MSLASAPKSVPVLAPASAHGSAPASAIAAGMASAMAPTRCHPAPARRSPTGPGPRWQRGLACLALTVPAWPLLAAPPTPAQCAQAQQALPSHQAAWRESLARRLQWPAAQLAERLTVTRSDVICWNEGILVAVQFTLRQGWAEVAGQERFPVLHTEQRNGTPLPSPRWVPAGPIERLVEGAGPAGLAPAELLNLAPDEPLLPADRADAEARVLQALQQRAGRPALADHGRLMYRTPRQQPTATAQPWLLLHATIDAAANRCGAGELNLVTGALDVREQPCRIPASGGAAS